MIRVTTVDSALGYMAYGIGITGAILGVVILTHRL